MRERDRNGRSIAAAMVLVGSLTVAVVLAYPAVDDPFSPTSTPTPTPTPTPTYTLTLTPTPSPTLSPGP